MKKYTFAVCVVALALSACGQSPAPAPAPAAPPKVTDQPANPTPPQSVQQMFDAKIDAVLAGNWREDANKARDPYRHPRQTLEFFGLKPGMSLIEITPGAGWYAEVLAPLMKDDGSYTAALMTPGKPDGEAARSLATMQKLFAGNPAEYGKAKIVEFDPKTPNLGAPNSADMVVTFRNVHNWVMADTAPAMFKAFFAVIKPGGVLGVVDHRATPGADLDKVKSTGYLPEDYVIKLATDAGFKLDGKSEINANAKDDHDHPKGVWTLPPTLALGDTDKAKYLAIGESDRMTLRFVKPEADKIFSAPADNAAKPATN
ncbi:MAG: methyltransferase [Xanthomonadaceae bacterium]|nr:methyltransferase [Xanthomonadaceae bacterium]MDE1884790.1 class I SAM-dependent methyltransferase [Xanthomonadaceae bacterium]MDE2258528.1 class I SAM-dependent methyltransferase [Xanthomonadaceae bacterium]